MSDVSIYRQKPFNYLFLKRFLTGNGQKPSQKPSNMTENGYKNGHGKGTDLTISDEKQPKLKIPEFPSKIVEDMNSHCVIHSVILLSFN
jgi:hypothetical protein